MEFVVKEKPKERWVVITHLVSVGLCNLDGARWSLQFSRYTDETRKAVCASIGHLDVDGRIVVTDPSKHKVIISQPVGRDANYVQGKGLITWLEKQKEQEE